MFRVYTRRTDETKGFNVCLKATGIFSSRRTESVGHELRSSVRMKQKRVPVMLSFYSIARLNYTGGIGGNMEREGVERMHNE